MNGQHLVYFADPMCSWCWGFSAVIEAIDEVWGDTLPIRLVMGGLRPGTTEPMTEAAKTELRGHWRQVTEASGRPFGPSGLDAPGFVYDTDPAARAVVLLRREDPAQAVPFLHAVQEAFYAGGLDVTDPAVLGSLAAGFGREPDAFVAELGSEALEQETWRDYAISQNAGVRGFPTLIVGPQADGTYVAISRGFQPSAVVLPAIAARLAAAA
ncbi:MAG: protein-disulfide isomerase [Caulobacteraceae bacterium]|jgi:putative protein-disulfide isomerase|nr:protein-disulfide isomerase [Caulobacteraceae bacterium]